MAFYDASQLIEIGFAKVGRGVRISTRAALHGVSRIEIGDHTRIDDFVVISAGEGGLTIGRNVHVATMCSIIGAGHVELCDFSGFSSRVSLYSSSDDYSGEWMTNPTVPSTYTKVDSRPVHVGPHAIVGAGSIILPGSWIGAGVAVGAHSLVKGKLDDFGIYAGNPCRWLKQRGDRILSLEQQYRAAAPH